MSSSIAIPQRQRQHADSSFRYPAAIPSSTTSSSSSTFAYGSFAVNISASANAPASPELPSRERRPSLMSPSFTEVDQIVVNVGNPEHPRLVSCVKASQGFHWNQEIFLPSYIDPQPENLERKQDPVQDIFVTDEEVANMFPS